MIWRFSPCCTDRSWGQRVYYWCIQNKGGCKVLCGFRENFSVVFKLKPSDRVEKQV